MPEKEPFIEERIDKYPKFGEDQDEIDEEENWERTITYEKYIKEEQLLEKDDDDEIEND